MKDKINRSILLSDGVELPTVGLGTYLSPDGNVVAESIRYAIECGYRHIDTAEFYNNEKGVGEGVATCGLKRNEIFLVSKVWNTNMSFDKALDSCMESLKKLGTDYLDMLLVHWPNPIAQREDYPRPLIETWRAFEKLQKDGRVRTIGVSNCQIKHLNSLFGDCNVLPTVNQIESHPGYIQQDVIDFCKQNGVAVEAWSPLCKARIMDNKSLVSIAQKYNKTPGQILINFALTNGIVALPKSVSKSRIKENFDVFDFVLAPEDYAIVANIQDAGRIGHRPDEAPF